MRRKTVNNLANLAGRNGHERPLPSPDPPPLRARADGDRLHPVQDLQEQDKKGEKAPVKGESANDLAAPPAVVPGLGAARHTFCL